MSLVHATDYATNNTLTEEFALAYLFAAPTNDFYKFYENNSTSLSHDTKELLLPATSVPGSGYMYMFAGCQGLTQAPELPATTVGMGSYHQMFAECTGLTAAPALLATTLSEMCYSNMFDGCTSLTTAPDLPATTLATGCYMGMFTNCTSLVNAPALPATTLAEDCYHRMFEGCTSLTKAPDLPAATLFGQVYGGMFDGCTSLNYVRCLATNLGENVGVYSSVADWLNNVSPTGTFVKDPDMTGWPIGTIDGIPAGWTVKDDMTNVPLTFEVISGTALISLRTKNYWASDLKVRQCTNGTWGAWQSSETNYYYMLSAGDKIQFKKENNDPLATGDQNYCYFQTSGNCYVYGNIMSLFNFETTLESEYACDKLFMGNNYIKNHPTKDLTLGATTLAPFCYKYMFANCKGLTRPPLMPATTLADNCYKLIFGGCTNLQTPPELPVTTLASNCYNSMFYNCPSLQTAPELPATTLAEGCYQSMFEDCSSLQSAPSLPATTMVANCYYNMFRGCTSLQTAPELPATTLAPRCYYGMLALTSIESTPALPVTELAEYCYEGMFSGCTGLTTAPVLPATTMKVACYSYMFSGCTNLENAPELPSMELIGSCYSNMFSNCTNLETAPELPATTIAYNCYNYMFAGCTSLTKAPDLPATTLESYCYNNMFNGCTNLNYVKCLATDISANYCTTDWLSGVAENGTFIKAAGMEDWTVGPQGEYNQVNGIPEGWTVDNIDVFTTDGNWGVAANWSGNAVPAAGSDVAIVANAKVPSNYTADADNIDVYGSLTIADGGQLKHSNAIHGTIQKFVEGYGPENANTNQGYYLLRSPVPGMLSLAEAIDAGMVNGTEDSPDFDGIDLYYFNPRKPGEEWQNVKIDSDFASIGISANIGYLYANENDDTLSFATYSDHLFPATTTDAEVLAGRYATTSPFIGWELIGNPFTCDAYLASGRDFYRMNATGNAIVLATDNVIKPCEGIFVVVSENDPETWITVPESSTLARIHFTTTEPAPDQSRGKLDLKVSRDNTLADVARVRFSEGENVGKMVLSDNATRLSINKDGEDFSVVHSNTQGELPLSFKAEKNGTYTLSFTGNVISSEADVISSEAKKSIFTYLHLIDHLTGKDVNLLENPSYTFEAKTTDYASRFKLVFSNTEDDGPSTSSGTFAFMDANGNIIITDGPSTGPSTSSGYHSGISILQIFDVLGHQVFAEELSTVNYQLSTANFLPGVYVLRLINGDSVRTQKIVIK